MLAVGSALLSDRLPLTARPRMASAALHRSAALSAGQHGVRLLYSARACVCVRVFSALMGGPARRRAAVFGVEGHPARRLCPVYSSAYSIVTQTTCTCGAGCLASSRRSRFLAPVSPRAVDQGTCACGVGRLARGPHRGDGAVARGKAVLPCGAMGRVGRAGGMRVWEEVLE